MTKAWRTTFAGGESFGAKEKAMAYIPKVVVLDPLTEEFKQRWWEDLHDLPVELMLQDQVFPRALEDLVHAATIIITRYEVVGDKTLAAAGDNLRLIIKLSRWPIGIDLKACQERGVRVVCIPQLGSIAVAEHAMALILACARDLIRAHKGVVAGDYRRFGLIPQPTTERSFAFKWLPVNPFEVYGRVLGIVGFGEIGKELAWRARAFGMTILYWDKVRAPREIEEELESTFCPLDELLERSDFVSLHVPHTKETEKMIDRRRIRKMKSTAFLINTARGGVVDELALVEALQSGQIAGAGLDVFAEEPLPADHPLTKMDNVILTPHIGGGSGRGREDLRVRIRELVLQYICS
ncbi:MAG: NAD(P)-dependent oxidoreductase [Candidatus Methanomethylicaceae archaeon]